MKLTETTLGIKTIKTFFGVEPVIAVKESDNGDIMGLHRDRCPDAGWDEFRWTKIDSVESTILDQELMQTLIEDICEYYGGANSYKKLKEFGIV